MLVQALLMKLLLLLQFIWLFSVVTLGPVTYDDYHYPQWAIAMGWSIGVCSIIPIPAYALYKIATTEGPIRQVGSQVCLLYTSPSPRDRHASRMPSSA